MGHDIHFLERLERYSPSHTELAMSLYRDPQLIKAVLNDRCVPDGAERVAIAISDEPKGPHIVVQRNGRFVTALGKGMTVRDLPIISRAALDAAGARLERLRSLIEEAKTVAGPSGLSSSVLRRMLTAGPWLSREEAASAAVWVRLGGDFHSMMIHLVKTCENLRLGMIRDQTVRRSRHKVGPSLKRSYWELTWAYAHLLGLVMDAEPEFFWSAPEQSRPEFLGLVHVDCFVGSGLRAAWVAARFGKPLLAGLKEHWSLNRHAHDDVRVIADSLAILALRHSKLRTEAEKILHRPPGFWKTLTGDELQNWNTEAEEVASYARRALSAPDTAERIYEGLARKYAVVLTRHLDDGSPARYQHWEDVPQDIALAVPLLLGRAPKVLSARGRTLMSAALPWLARVSLEETYLPGEYLRAWETPFRVEWIDDLAMQLYTETKAETVVHDSPRVGRNDPCTCGSGKKFKKCCAA